MILIKVLYLWYNKWLTVTIRWKWVIASGSRSLAVQITWLWNKTVCVLFLLDHWLSGMISGKVGLPRWLSGKESICQRRRQRRPRFDPCIRKTPGGGNCNLLQDSHLENSMDRGAWRAAIHGVAKSGTWQPARTAMTGASYLTSLRVSIPVCKLGKR